MSELKKVSDPVLFNAGIVYHLREADLAVAQDILCMIIDSSMGIDEQKNLLDMVVGFLQRIGGLELSARQDKIEIHNLMTEVKDLDKHLNPAFEDSNARS